MNNFDFLVGTWDSTQRKLKKWLVGCEEWDEFTGQLRNYSMFNGAANVDELTFPETGNAGVSLRLYDPETECWSIYWVDSRTGTLGLPPVVGRFTDGVGEFFADEKNGGHWVRVRFRWSDITATTARWEQAFSTDNGETWEVNWIANFTRTGS